MNLSYRVTLSGIKGFFRVYHITGDTTLYTFHKQMRSDMEFPQDQLIMFKGLDPSGEVIGRYGLFDLGSGTVDEITMEKTVELGITTFIYYYDVTNRKSVNILFEGEVQDSSVKTGFPIITESKGPNPIEFENGYVAFEDLPDEHRHLPGENSVLGGFDLGDDDEDFDEEDEDEDDEDGDDEDGKEIFDESEGI